MKRHTSHNKMEYKILLSKCLQHTVINVIGLHEAIVQACTVLHFTLHAQKKFTHKTF